MVTRQGGAPWDRVVRAAQVLAPHAGAGSVMAAASRTELTQVSAPWFRNRCFRPWQAEAASEGTRSPDVPWD